MPRYKKALRRCIFDDFMNGMSMSRCAVNWGVSEKYVSDAIRAKGDK